MRLFRIYRHDGGASAAEYALLIAIVGVALAFACLALGGAISGAINTADTHIRDAK